MLARPLRSTIAAISLVAQAVVLFVLPAVHGPLGACRHDHSAQPCAAHAHEHEHHHHHQHGHHGHGHHHAGHGGHEHECPTAPEPTSSHDDCAVCKILAQPLDASCEVAQLVGTDWTRPLGTTPGASPARQLAQAPLARGPPRAF